MNPQYCTKKAPKIKIKLREKKNPPTQTNAKQNVNNMI